MKKSSYLIYVLSAIIMMAARIPVFGQEVETPDYPALIKEAVDNLDYQKGAQYIPYLEYRDSLTLLTMFNIADCYIGNQLYEQCIRFCDRCIRKHPDEGYEEMLDDKYGESYYYLGKYDKAVPYLRHYVTWAEDNGYSAGSYFLGLFSEALFETHDYKNARIYFEKTFEEAAKLEGLTVETLNRSKYVNSHAFKFYDCAYSFFYLGDEVNGKRMLELASKCGYDYAKQDLSILNKCPTFAKEFDIKSRYIYEWDELISKYDIKYYIARLDNSNPKAFWDKLQIASPDYVALMDAMAKDRRPKTLEKAVNDINSSKAELNYRLYLCNPYKKGDIENNLESTLYGIHSPIQDFRIYPSSDINAFATPYGQIYLTEGIVDRFHCNSNLLMGVCAHESTHFMCQHSLSSLWQSAEKARKNEIWGGIAAGLSMAAMAGAGMYAAANGVSLDQDYWDNSAKLSVGLMESFAQSAYLFKFKYSRNQEIESDIIAYRFCEWMGLSGYSYIMALQMLGDEDLYLKSDDTSDHPTTAYRVLLLKYLYAKDRHDEAVAIQNKDIRWLYDKLTEMGQKDLGTFEQFREKLRRDKYLKKYFDLSIEGELNVGTYEEFVETFKTIE